MIMIFTGIHIIGFLAGLVYQPLDYVRKGPVKREVAVMPHNKMVIEEEEDDYGQEEEEEEVISEKE